MRLTMASGAAQDIVSSGHPLGEEGENGFCPRAVKVGARTVMSLGLAPAARQLEIRNS